MKRNICSQETSLLDWLNIHMQKKITLQTKVWNIFSTQEIIKNMCMQFTLHGQGAPSKHIYCDVNHYSELIFEWDLRQDLGPDVAATHTKLNLPTNKTSGIWRGICPADKSSKQKPAFFFKKLPDLKNSVQDETSLKVLVMDVKCFGVNTQMKTMTQQRRLCHSHFVLYYIYWWKIDFVILLLFSPHFFSWLLFSIRTLYLLWLFF